MSGGNFLSTKDQIGHCKEKGIRFAGISEEEAMSYLENNNNYFKLRAYRKNYNKDKITGKYENLDFSDLIDLAIIDTRLRIIVLEMSLNIEHFSKVHLLLMLNKNNVDAYDILQDYLSTLDEKSMEYLKKTLEHSCKSLYCKDLYSKQSLEKMPVWAFIELLPFGEYIGFYLFCANRLKDRNMKNVFYLMLDVKKIRNAAAHNNCIINDLGSVSEHTVNYNVSNSLSKMGFSQFTKRNKLKKARIAQIIICLYAHKEIVTSVGVHKHVVYMLNEFKERLFRDKRYENNLQIRTVFELFQKVIDTWFSVV